MYNYNTDKTIKYKYHQNNLFTVFFLLEQKEQEHSFTRCDMAV